MGTAKAGSGLLAGTAQNIGLTAGHSSDIAGCNYHRPARGNKIGQTWDGGDEREAWDAGCMKRSDSHGDRELGLAERAPE